MKHFRIDASDPAKLHEQLLAAGVPVITVRSSSPSLRAKTALYGVVVTEDSADDAAVQVVIDAHVPTDAVPSKEKRDVVKAQAQMEGKNAEEVQAEVAAVIAAELELPKE